MFPYVCIATMPLFCEPNWPRKLEKIFKVTINEHVLNEKAKVGPHNNELKPHKKVKWGHQIVVAVLLSYCGLQIFLPYSHFITKVKIVNEFFIYIYLFVYMLISFQYNLYIVCANTKSFMHDVANYLFLKLVQILN